MTASRRIACQVMTEVLQGSSLSDSLTRHLAVLSVRDQSFVQALCYGVCRLYHQLEFILEKLLSKPLKNKDTDLFALLLIGLYQLKAMRVPAHAAVAETVQCVEAIHKNWAKGLINAVLRNYLRQAEKIEQDVAAYLPAATSHPQWWIEKLKQAWPEHWQTILQANNTHPPFALRVNERLLTRESYLAKLKEQQLTAQEIPETQAGIVLAEALPVETLPGFLQGEVLVQDGAAQLAAALLQLEPGQRVLDACAAPGGKLTHLLAHAPKLKQVVALEKDADRLEVIRENFARLKLTDLPCQLICHDAADTQWWDGTLFDRILIDAPCSASGVVRRHPDIKLLRRPEDIANLVNEQQRLLEALWPLLKADGLLLYATCSIFPEENAQGIAHFITNTPTAREEKIDASWGIACSVGRQILPGMAGMDGFYYACLRKYSQVATFT